MNQAESISSELAERINMVSRKPKAQAEFDRVRRLSQKLKPSRKWQQMKLQPDQTPDGGSIYSNNIYTCTVRRLKDGWPLGGGEWVQIGIYCEDGEARHDFRDFQCIKNDICGPEWEGIELYPAESRLLDPSNYNILWCAPSINIGQRRGRTIMGPENCLAPQRGWAK